MNYDRQVIFYVPSGSTLAAEKAVKTNAERLHGKHVGHSALIKWTKQGPGLGDVTGTQNAVAQLTNNSRVYLVSHGNPSSFAGLTADDLAKLLVITGGVTVARRVVLVACRVGQEETTDPFKKLLNEYAATNASAASFLDVSYAQKFHLALGKTHNLYTEVGARTEYVAVAADGHKWTTPTVQAPTFGQKQADSKVVWSWDAPRKQQIQTKPY